MEKMVTIPRYILDNASNAIRLAANALGSRSRETAMDRQIEYAERLLKWVEQGQIGGPPRVIPPPPTDKQDKP